MMSNRILIVDSDDANAARIARTLSGVGFCFEVANTSAAAARVVEEADVSFVVVAEHLSDTDGLDCFARLKRAKRSLVGLLMSDRADLGAVVSAMTYGIERVLTRPADPAEVIEAITEVASDYQPLSAGT